MKPIPSNIFLLILMTFSWWQAGAAFGQKKESDKFNIQVMHISAQIQKQPVTIIERPAHVLYFAPYFTANATLQVDVPNDSDYTFGFIQQVDTINQVNRYEQATTTWEMPQLPILDLSGRGKTYWYDAKNGSYKVKAGTRKLEFSLSLDDNLMSYVSWSEPLPAGFEKRAPGKLQSISREQSFTSWLVAVRATDDRIIPIRKITWSIAASISVDTRKPVGLRCQVNHTENPPPKISDARNEKFPRAVLKSTPANNASQFWWSTKQGSRVQLNHK